MHEHLQQKDVRNKRKGLRKINNPIITALTSDRAVHWISLRPPAPYETQAASNIGPPTNAGTQQSHPPLSSSQVGDPNTSQRVRHGLSGRRLRSQTQALAATQQVDPFAPNPPEHQPPMEADLAAAASTAPAQRASQPSGHPSTQINSSQPDSTLRESRLPAPALSEGQQTSKRNKRGQARRFLLSVKATCSSPLPYPSTTQAIKHKLYGAISRGRHAVWSPWRL